MRVFPLPRDFDQCGLFKDVNYGFYQGFSTLVDASTSVGEFDQCALVDSRPVCKALLDAGFVPTLVVFRGKRPVWGTAAVCVVL